MGKQIFSVDMVETPVFTTQVDLICEVCGEVMAVDGGTYTPYGSLRIEHNRKYVCYKCGAYFLQDINDEPYPRIVHKPIKTAAEARKQGYGPAVNDAILSAVAFDNAGNMYVVEEVKEYPDHVVITLTKKNAYILAHHTKPYHSDKSRMAVIDSIDNAKKQLVIVDRD